ncbi:MAG: PilZ domain-containing protein [Planctomycetaceae bacterium]|nr:PilZ domain-containing protein [Planctomycetaceae bacterium]
MGARDVSNPSHAPTLEGAAGSVPGGHAVAPGPNGAERRRSERAPFPARVVVAWRDGAGACETHAVLDMSLGGFRLHSDHEVPVGRVGRAVQILPDRTAVDLDVLVVWSVRKPADASHGSCEFGVRFVGD